MKENNSKILLVDDEPDITFALGVGLEDNGFAVDTFNDPLLALQSFKEKKEKERDKQPYSLALIDVKMPNMNGFELYNEIRKIDNEVKVCFITAFEIQKEEYFDYMETTTSSNDKDKTIVIRKPIAIEELVKKVGLIHGY